MKRGVNAMSNVKNNGMSLERARQLLHEAELLRSAEDVAQAIGFMARRINHMLADKFPLVLTVMNGGMWFAGRLLPLLDFPLTCDYIHASRYRQETRGGKIDWLATPRESLKGRHVLVLDDILDEGHTLAAIAHYLRDAGAKHVTCAVLVEKQLNIVKPLQADFVGITVPNRYVFGCGMDIYGVWRNLPAIYAVRSAIPDSSTEY